MRFGRGTIQEWHCFRRVEVDLSRVRVASVIGRMAHDPERSNGTGKSYFIESTVYALFGYDRDPASVQRLKAADDTFVEWNFEHRGRAARVKRGFKRKKDGSKGAGILEFEIDGQPQGEKVTEIQEAIERFVGCPSNIYRATSFFIQGDADQFVTTTPADRKRIFSDLLGLSLYEQARIAADREIAVLEASISDAVRRESVARIAHEEAGRQARALSALDLPSSLAATEAAIEALVALQGDYSESLQSARSWGEAIPGLVQEFNAARRVKEAADSAESGLRTVLKQAQDRKAARHRALAEAYKVRQERIRGVPAMEAAVAKGREDLKAAEAVLAAIVVEDKAPWQSAEREASQIVGEANAEMRAAEADIRRIDTLGAFCGSCQQAIGPEHKESHRKAAQDRHAAAAIRLGAARERCTQARQQQVRIDQQAAQRAEASMRLASLRPALEAQERALADAQRAAGDHVAAVESAKAEMESFDTEIVQHEEALAKTSAETVRASVVMDTARDAVEAARGSIDEAIEPALARFHSRIVARYKAVVAERDSITDRIRSLDMVNKRVVEAAATLHEVETQTRAEREKIETLRFLSKAFSKNGIPHLVAENVVAEIEKGTVEILQALESPNRVIFRMATETGQDTIQIEVETPDGTRSVKSFSGGQVTEQNLAIRLALSEVLSRRAEVAFESVFLDEVMAALDGPARQCFLRVVNLMRRSFSQILVISHHSEIRDFLESRITVEWHPDGATVEVS